MLATYNEPFYTISDQAYQSYYFQISFKLVGTNNQLHRHTFACLSLTRIILNRAAYTLEVKFEERIRLITRQLRHH